MQFVIDRNKLDFMAMLLDHRSNFLAYLFSVPVSGGI